MAVADGGNDAHHRSTATSVANHSPDSCRATGIPSTNLISRAGQKSASRKCDSALVPSSAIPVARISETRPLFRPSGRSNPHRDLTLAHCPGLSYCLSNEPPCGRLSTNKGRTGCRSRLTLIRCSPRSCVDEVPCVAPRNSGLPQTLIERFDPCSISATHFLGHSFGIIPAPGVFASSAFPVPPCYTFGSLPECSRSSWEQYPLALECPEKPGQKWRLFSYVSQSRPINWLPRERPGEAASALSVCDGLACSNA